MRKYWEVSKIYMKSQLIWRADVFFNMVFTIGKILFAYLLWGIIFENQSTVGGFTFSGMLSYYVMNSFLSQLEMSQGISEEINHRIRNGTFSKYMILPISKEGYFLTMELGIVLFHLIFDFLTAFVWIIIFKIEFVYTKNVLILLSAFFMSVMGMIFMVQLNYFLGILTLKYQGIDTFLRIKNNFIALVTGTIIPLDLFPEILINIMKLLPFYYVSYLPAMLVTGNCQDEAFWGLCVIGIWCVVVQMMINIVWNSYSRKYDGVGI